MSANVVYVTVCAHAYTLIYLLPPPNMRGFVIGHTASIPAYNEIDTMPNILLGSM